MKVSVWLLQKVEMDNWLTTNKPNWGSNWGAGDVMYKDLNGDGIVKFRCKYFGRSR